MKTEKDFELVIKKIRTVYNCDTAYESLWKMSQENSKEKFEEGFNEGVRHGYNKRIDLPEDVKKSLTPHRCPICGGNGLVSGAFYTSLLGCGGTSANITEQCRSCNGVGILYS